MGLQQISAQENIKQPAFFKSLNYQVRAHYGLGGSTPVNIPVEIRKINSYNPALNLGLEANATKWFETNKSWGLRLGLKFETKGMKTQAEVLNYYTQISYNQAEIDGYFTGEVTTNVKNSYLTIPVLAVYQLSNKWRLYSGFYFSAAIDTSFNGYVSNGYLKQNNIEQTKINFDSNNKAPYDFSKDVNKFQWGIQAGAEWVLNHHFILFPEITYGINGLMNNDFKAITFKMHQLYLNLGFGYQF